MNEHKYAIIDMGSNSIRLVINSIDNHGYYKELYNFKVVARLSSLVTKEGLITNHGKETILETLKKFEEIINDHHVDEVKGVATAAVRKAVNQQEILQAISNETSLKFDVLSEYEEAYYGYLAVVNSTNLETGVTIDIGGGSTEVTLFDNRELIHYHSFPFGAITLKQQFIQHDQPTNEELQELISFLNSQFSSLPWLHGCNLPVIGIGGSARNLSLVHQLKVNYPLSGLHQYVIKLEDIQSILEQFVSLSFEERQNIDGLSNERADIIIPAVQAIASLMTMTASTQFIMSNKGLRDGIFHEKVFQKLGLKQFPNVAEESFYQLTQSYNINMYHVKQIAKIAGIILKQTHSLSESTYTLEEDLRLLRYSTRVLYLGEFISSEASSQHTFYLLTNMTIDGLSHEDRLAIAFIASFKSRSYLNKYSQAFSELVTSEQLKRYERLGAILKLAYSLNRTRRNVITDITVTKLPKRALAFYIQCRKDAHFEGQQSQKYKKHLEKAIGFQVELQFEQNSSN
ncbi:Ppx/GppA phosphatase family protein [Bacillus sp. FJAT-45350]|uniref:Ppx/GppA phosphatase family protein n=1 Tax=Bacillus sp. FJAT-45350 TaxID=2011014 RepID=UPI000BB9B926|nr:Ppx/GppA phosphatase family protein [Bacillus sp. FJAT-45350]